MAEINHFALIQLLDVPIDVYVFKHFDLWFYSLSIEKLHETVVNLKYGHRINWGDGYVFELTGTLKRLTKPLYHSPWAQGGHHVSVPDIDPVYALYCLITHKICSEKESMFGK